LAHKYLKRTRCVKTTPAQGKPSFATSLHLIAVERRTKP